MEDKRLQHIHDDLDDSNIKNEFHKNEIVIENKIAYNDYIIHSFILVEKITRDGVSDFVQDKDVGKLKTLHEITCRKSGTNHIAFHYMQNSEYFNIDHLITSVDLISKLCDSILDFIKLDTIVLGVEPEKLPNSIITIENTIPGVIKVQDNYVNYTAKYHDDKSIYIGYG